MYFFCKTRKQKDNYILKQVWVRGRKKARLPLRRCTTFAGQEMWQHRGTRDTLRNVFQRRQDLTRFGFGFWDAAEPFARHRNRVDGLRNFGSGTSCRCSTWLSNYIFKRVGVVPFVWKKFFFFAFSREKPLQKKRIFYFIFSTINSTFFT